MKFHLIVEDTVNGVSCKVAYEANEVSDSMENSLSAKVVANFSGMVRECQQAGVLYVEKD